jgi:hypothetical protein
MLQEMFPNLEGEGWKGAWLGNCNAGYYREENFGGQWRGRTRRISQYALKSL